ncbi:MAG: hypothetical protein JWM71_2533 [Solirubrobacteraceae bacterium]|nr:hypothetical protein [Solirubrobacteraceae bacterium]
MTPQEPTKDSGGPAPRKRLIPGNSNIALELTRVSAALDQTPFGSAKRLPLLRRQAALGDLRDDIAQRARRDPSR